MKDLISLYRDAVRDDWDKQTDATLANMQEAELNLLSRLSAGEAAVKKVEELEKEVERLEGRHCADCCCDKSWKALGITEYTGKSIPEHIAELRRQAAAGQIAVDAMEKFSNKYKQWVSDYSKVVQKSKFFDDLIEMLQHKEAL